MSLAKEFREFALRGNVVDLAVGIIIGGAFGKIVSSLVNDVFMPPLGAVIGGVDFSRLSLTIKAATVSAAGKDVPAVTINYGTFINTIVDFVIVAAAIFIVVKLMNAAKRQQEVKPAPAPAPPKQEVLLGEIRDILKARS